MHKPTRDLLDLFLTTEENLAIDLSVGVELRGGGHRMVSFEIRMKEDVTTSEERLLITDVRILTN